MIRFICGLTAFFLLAGVAPVFGAETDDLHTFKVVLLPVREVELIARVEGMVKRCGFLVGRNFRTGDVLLEIDDDHFRLELKRAEARLNEIKAQLKFARENYETGKRLYTEKVQSQNELERRGAEVEALEAREASAVADVENMRLQLSYCIVKAPFDGRLEQMLCRQFENVRAGQGICRILDDGKLLAVMNIPPALLKPVGAVFSFDFGTAGKVDGKVYEVSPRVEHRSGTVEVKVLIENHDRKLISGLVGHLIPPSSR